MKKVSLLIAMIAFVCGNAFAQLSYDFEDGVAGAKIAQTYGDPWTTWSNAPGGAEDGVFAEQNSMAAHFTYGNDQVLDLGNVTTGTWELSFDMYIPNGKDAYNNILHIFNGSGSEWATEVWYKTSDNGTAIKAANVTTNFDCPFDSWFTVKYVVDLDNDEATFYVDDEEIYTWQYSLQADGTAGSRQLAAMDFYPPTSAAVSDYYIDNVYAYKLGGVSAPVLSVTPESISEELPEDEIVTVDVTISNTGNSIGDWNAYVDFGHGGAGTQTSELAYHNGQEAQGIGSTGGPYTREMAMRLPATAYAGAAMGMKITSVKYQVGSTYKSEDNTYTFRLYGQGANNQPGELLAEKTVVSSELGVWLTATFDEDVYMDGQTIWATVELLQTAGEYPLTMDEGHYGEEGDGNWLSTQGGSFDHCYSAGNFEGAWLITVNCEGELIPGSWATLNKYVGSIPGGNEETITLSLNSIGLDMGSSYSANLVINTNDENVAHVEIPVTLAVTDGVEETATQLASIYPNPATSMVTLEGENLNSVAIYNVAGQLIRVEKLGAMVNNINMDVEAGVYFFSVYDNNGNNSVQRVVIVK